MRRITGILLLFPLFLPYSGMAASGKILTGKVMQVKDGDTVVISPIEGGQFFTCRLYGIDSPESYGKEAAGIAKVKPCFYR